MKTFKNGDLLIHIAFAPWEADFNKIAFIVEKTERNTYKMLFRGSVELWATDVLNLFFEKIKSI